MIITYERGCADTTKIGENWKALRWVKHNDSLIIYSLWKVILANLDKEFSEICELIKEGYKNKTVKSRVDIYYENGKLEIIRKGVFPNIMIIKDSGQ